MIKERPLTESDKDWLLLEILNDKAHADCGMTPAFFGLSGDDNNTQLAKNTFSVCTEDDEGPVYVVQFAHVLRANIQFCRKQASKKRIVKAFMKQFPKVMNNARNLGYKQVFVNTESPSLRRWCEKHLGFKHILSDLSRFL